MMLLAFDARSFAPFAFSPVAFAIQALIEEIQRREEYHGGGGRRGRAEPPKRSPIQQRQQLTEDEVRAQWELLELRQRNQAERQLQLEQQIPRPVPASVASPPVQPVAVARPALPASASLNPEPLASVELRNSVQRDDDALALLLLLSEV